MVSDSTSSSFSAKALWCFHLCVGVWKLQCTASAKYSQQFTFSTLGYGLKQKYLFNPALFFKDSSLFLTRKFSFSWTFNVTASVSHHYDHVSTAAKLLKRWLSFWKVLLSTLWPFGSWQYASLRPFALVVHNVLPQLWMMEATLLIGTFVAVTQDSSISSDMYC